MASGDLLFVLKTDGATPPDTNPATPDLITAITGFRECFDFDGATDESMIWEFVWPPWYDGGGVTIKYHYSMDGTSTGGVEIEFSVETTGDLADQDAGGVDFGTTTPITDTPGGTANQLNITATGTISHANCGSPAVDDGFRLRALRDVSFATNTDDLQLQKIIVKET